MLLETVFVILSDPPIEEEMPNLKQFPLELSQIKNWIFEFKKWLNG